MDASRDVTVRFEWTDVGAVTLDRSQKLSFPVLDRIPGVYRLHIVDGDRDSAYVGEASNLRRRAQNYRTPGPTQQTSKRINALLLGILARGGEIKVSTATEAFARSAGNSWTLDLNRKAARVLVEHAELALTTLPVENL